MPLLGVAAMAPASNLPEFIDTLLSGPAGPIFGGFILSGFADWYEDVEFNAYVCPGARSSQQKLVTRCISEPSFLANLASALIVEPFTLINVREGPLFEHLQQNVPDGEFSAPLLVGQGDADTLITPAAQKSYVENLCSDGQVVEYRTYAGRDHMGLVAEDSRMLDDLRDWTTARFAGDPAPLECITYAAE